MNQSDQDLILDAAGDPQKASILAAILREFNGDPIQAARMAGMFRTAKAVLTETVEALPALWAQLDKQLTEADLRRTEFTQDLRTFRLNNAGELAAAVADLKKVQDFFAEINKSDFLNQANRVLDVCERLQKAKKDGTLDWITRLNQAR